MGLKARRIGPVTYVLVLSIGAIVRAAVALVLCERLVPQGFVARETAVQMVRAALVAFGALYVRMTVGRLRDIGFTTWWARGVAMAPIGIVMLPILFFYGGEPWDTEQGEAPQRSGALKIVLAYGALFLGLGLIWLAILALIALSA